MTDIKTVGVVGLGMIGASIAGGLSAAGSCVFGCDKNDEVQKFALEKGYIGAPLSDVSLLDVLVIALSEKDTVSALKRYAPLMKAGATLMDVCGNKRGVADCMQELGQKYPQLHFVGTHPMAGRETDGRSPGIFKASKDLFVGAYIVFVPIAGDEAGVDAAATVYRALGIGGIRIADAESHDAMIAYTSQLAHILSSAYVKNPKVENHQGFSAGSFQDLTRVARLDVHMWAALFIENKDKLVPDIDMLLERLTEYRDALEEGGAKKLEALLEDGNKFKDAAEKSARSRTSDI